MTIDYDLYIEKIVDIKVPHSIYELFIYEDQYDYTQTNIHYGTYHLHQLLSDIEDYDIDEEDKTFIEEVYKVSEHLFMNEKVNKIRFLDEEF